MDRYHVMSIFFRQGSSRGTPQRTRGVVTHDPRAATGQVVGAAKGGCRERTQG
jgi:hypothetical protein